jgi:hypothetical protein
MFKNVKQVGSDWRLDTTVDELLEWGRGNPVTSNGRNANTLADLADKRETRAHWFGMDADRIASLTDWPEGRELVEECRRSLPPLPALKSIRRVSAWAEDGDEFDRDRFDAGLDDAWRTKVRGVRPGSTVLKLTCEIGGLSSKTAEQLAWSGALAVAICDTAESAGYRVEIEAIHRSRRCFTNGNYSLKVIRVKAADEPIMLDRVCMALACPAFFRWFVMGSSTNFHRSLNVKSGFGSTADCPDDLHGDLHIGHCYDRYEASYLASRMIRQIGRMAGEPEPERPWSPPYVPPVYTPPTTPTPPVVALPMPKEPKPKKEAIVHEFA